MSNILTLKEVIKRGLSYELCNNGDYTYQTEDGYCHLIRDGMDLLEGKKAICPRSFDNGDYSYGTENGKRVYIEYKDYLKEQKK